MSRRKSDVDMQVVVVRLPLDLKRRLRQQASFNDRTMSDHVRHIQRLACVGDAVPIAPPQGGAAEGAD